MYRLRRAALLLLFALSMLASACKKDPMRVGRAAWVQEDADAAEKAFEKVLQEDPDNFEARRMLADVPRFRGNYQKSEQELLTLWKKKGFDDEDAELSVEDRVTRQNMQNQFDELYRTWAGAIDPKEEPDKFERVVEKGLEHDPKSPRLNRMLVDFYLHQAENLVEKGKKQQAAETFEKVLAHGPLPKERKEAARRAKKLWREAFDDAAKERLDDQLVPAWTKAERWDAEHQTVTVRVEQEVDRSLRTRSTADRRKARKIAGKALEAAIADVVEKVAGVPADTAPRLVDMPDFQLTDESFHRHVYTMVAAIARKPLVEAAFHTHERVRDAADSGPARPARPSPAPDAGRGDAGVETP